MRYALDLRVGPLGSPDVFVAVLVTCRAAIRATSRQGLRFLDGRTIMSRFVIVSILTKSICSMLMRGEAVGQTNLQ